MMICRLLATLAFYSIFYVDHVEDAINIHDIFLAQLRRQTVKLTTELQLYVLGRDCAIRPEMRIESRS